ncbi:MULTISPECIES: phosphoribosylglycinamide formyltransferase [Enterococcus]|uniref:phosphoribosylglycinamide formyltransferase n=1 Tax=Enterococcus TaxID=1350 RepID=UPI00195B5B67|nr:phosphoribosylglycinamide formyltransferase [Enterococcus diestrammenae]HIX69422.1 phosphoribosylglycinamide formyltransferase [Candidatus Enterococcus stercoravium]
MRYAVLASGNGSNFEAIITASKRGQIPGTLALVFSDQPEAFVLQRAQAHQVPATSFTVKEKGGKQAYEAALLALLKAEKIDYLVLAGYMRIIGPELIAAFPSRIINIHPSLLPAFPGLHGIEDAFKYGVKVTGVTVHFVDQGVDTGPIIAQQAVTIGKLDTLDTLEEKIHQVEHRLYPAVLQQLFAEK